MFKISDLFKTSDEISSILPNIIVESAILTRNIMQGLHSSRFSGKGETFWQFKEYRQDDSVSSIDWRKSASLNKLLVKEKENETSKLIYFHYDKTKSMSFKSSKGIKSKYYISVLITLTLSRIFLRNRENIFHFKDKKTPIKSSYDLSSFDKSFLSEESNLNFPDTSLIKNNSSVFIFSDFFYEIKYLKTFMNELKKKNVEGYIFQILDPAEVDFNIQEYSLVHDMENDSKLLMDSSYIYKESYKKNLKALQIDLNYLCDSYNWHYLFYKTSDALKPFILEIIKKTTLRKN